MTLILNTVKVLRTFARMTAAKLVIFALSIYEGMNGNPAFPEPPVDMPTLKASIDSLSSATTEALNGGTLARAARDSQTVALIAVLSQLAHYFQATSPNETAFKSSGFQPAPTTRTQTPPISEKIRKIVPGPRTGELLIYLMKILGAASYQIRYAPDAGNGLPSGDWTIVATGRIRPPFLIDGLKTGTTYLFQARALMKPAGYTDWSDSITQVCL